MSSRDINEMLYGILKPDATLISLGVTGVYDTQAPESKPVPLIVFSKSDGTHEYTLTQRAWRTQTYLVKGIALENKDLAEQIDDRIDVLLNMTRPPVDNGVVMNLRRETDVSYAERVGGSVYYHVGGLYEVMVTGG